VLDNVISLIGVINSDDVKGVVGLHNVVADFDPSSSTLLDGTYTEYVLRIIGNSAKNYVLAAKGPTGTLTVGLTPGQRSGIIPIERGVMPVDPGAPVVPVPSETPVAPVTFVSRTDAGPTLVANGSALTTNVISFELNGKSVEINVQYENLTSGTFYENDCMATVYAMLASAYEGYPIFANSYTSPNYTTGATPDPRKSKVPDPGAPILKAGSLMPPSSLQDASSFPFVLAGMITGNTSNKPWPHYMLAVGREPSTGNIIALDPLTGTQVYIAFSSSMGTYVVVGPHNAPIAQDKPTHDNAQQFYVMNYFYMSIGNG
jgi:hypothetical protein